ncbi:DUF4123 domain-containing protein [Marinobacter sp. X15-166B]|uniref:DUF4123 domain-containing protein n=1 Tax=Marinobacter sp. X15-166B TaxID=1897620 RepID=UPI00085CA2D7|nr:DUF4123 domain-containing protein [Marinobacter sp. X15-166B]OEY65908.1 hypothetical protein BG841_05195 [Marinobacter sp. X15-166B]
MSMPRISGDAETYILADGAKIDGLSRYIYGDEGAPVCEALYRGTELEGLMAISPWLVKAPLDGPFATRCFAGWVQHGVAIALASEFGIEQLARHCRDLLMALTTGGEPAIFRFYDPEILRGLLSTDRSGEDSGRLLGPASVVAVQERTTGAWEYFRQATPASDRQTAPFVIREKHLVAMEKAVQRTALRRLECHTATYFPQLMGSESRQEEGDSIIVRLIRAANGKGLWSTRDLALYINTHGWLGLDAFARADVTAIWDRHSSQPSQAIVRVAAYAEQQSREGRDYGQRQ